MTYPLQMMLKLMNLEIGMNRFMNTNGFDNANSHGGVI